MKEEADLIILNRIKEQQQKKAKTDREQLIERQAFGDAYNQKTGYKQRRNK
eukprot:CAMPEP_0201570014 /NCGR_PEP_ID=MMETSP0190_2-20130828/12049_1 /ASSEMBLY_ACC=CAM_ASM_000263 /TAXON_ID=37353 /ORGANISM="Rosalina sp." /LENGTH=50 /DNA_ID=CAMNT_0047993053 /DNA_START=8 /DNA_END=157 /DNA_ORIENTATION=-